MKTSELIAVDFSDYIAENSRILSVSNKIVDEASLMANKKRWTTSKRSRSASVGFFFLLVFWRGQ